MKKFGLKLTALLAGCICLAGIGTSWAHYANVVNIRNPLSTQNSSVELVENFNPNSSFLPGETVKKEPHFKNTGEIDLILRVKVEESWNNAEGTALEKGPGFPDTEIVEKNWTDSWKNEWVEIGNYYYYKKILTRAETSGSTTAIILESLRMKPEASNDSHSIDYSNLLYELKFEADAVPADELSLTVWKEEINTENGSGKGLEWQALLPQAN